VAHKSPSHGKVSAVVDRRNCMSCSEGDDLSNPRADECVIGHKKCSNPGFSPRYEGGINLPIASDIERRDLLAERARRLLYLSKLFCECISDGRISEHGDILCSRHQFVQQFYPFRPELSSKDTDAGQGAPRTVESNHKSRFNRIDS